MTTWGLNVFNAVYMHMCTLYVEMFLKLLSIKW
jgi:hypothetical protein